MNLVNIKSYGIALIFLAAWLWSFPASASSACSSCHGKEKHPSMATKKVAPHQHSSWDTPPKPFSGMRFENWNHPEWIRKGKLFFQDNCVDCHGKDGRGNGPMAKDLQHKPADLTNHFHCTSGKGDDYLYWRISQGGEVEPYRSQNSSMPAFDFLSEDERWATLAYVHSSFHEIESEDCSEKQVGHSKLKGHQD